MSNYVPGSVWFYQPNTGAPVFFTIAFFLSGAVHAWQTYHYKSWGMTLFLPWGATLMTAGYIMRELGSRHIGNVDFLISSAVLTLCGPPVFAGANYFMLGRTLYYVPWLAPVHPGRAVKALVLVDIAVAALIGNGASKVAYTSIDSSEHQLGEILVKVALILQLASAAVYIIILTTWHVRVQRAGLMARASKPWLRIVVLVLYASSTLLAVRCIYRIAQYFQGTLGTVYTHEAYFYVFDASLMLVNSVLLSTFHPGRLFPRSDRLYLAKDCVTEVMGPGWRDKRQIWRQITDPFNIHGRLRGERSDFWNWENGGAKGGDDTELLSAGGRQIIGSRV